MVSPNENALITKHNKLVEARYSLTLQEQRLVLWIVSQIEPEDDALSGFKIPIKDLAKFLGVERNKNLYAEVKDITGGLVTKLIQIDDLEKDRTIQTAWLSEAEYEYGEGTVRVNVSGALRGYLIGLKEQFTTYSLRIAVSLKSSYAIRIYELLMQYKRIGERTITIEQLRAYLGLKPEQYSKYSMFKKRTIERAQREINDKSDIWFEFEEIKQGRKVHAIKFRITANPSYGQVVKLPLGDEKGVGLVARLTSHGVKEKVAWDIVHAYIESDPVRITWHIDDLEKRISEGNPPRSMAGWLVKAIDTDHRPQQTLFETNTKQAKEKAEERRRARVEKERRIAQLEAQLSAQEKDYRHHVGECIEKWKKTLLAPEIEAVEGIIGTDLKDYAKRDLKKRPWGSMFNVHLLMRYCESQDAPLPYPERDAFFAQRDLPSLSDLEDELAKLRA